MVYIMLYFPTIIWLGYIGKWFVVKKCKIGLNSVQI